MCLDGEKVILATNKIYLGAQALSHGPRNGPSSSHNRSEVKGRRHGRLSGGSGQMKTSRKTKYSVLRHINVKFIGVTTPTPQQLNFVLRIPRSSSSRGCATSKT